jgi:hypothetical protein
MSSTIAERSADGPDSKTIERDGDWYEKFYRMLRGPVKAMIFCVNQRTKMTITDPRVGTSVALPD